MASATPARAATWTGSGSSRPDRSAPSNPAPDGGAAPSPDPGQQAHHPSCRHRDKDAAPHPTKPNTDTTTLTQPFPTGIQGTHHRKPTHKNSDTEFSPKYPAKTPHQLPNGPTAPPTPTNHHRQSPKRPPNTADPDTPTGTTKGPDNPR
ncbi:hypothetical protein GCM10010440_70900 [Kitasatospora cinereorecta]